MKSLLVTTTLRVAKFISESLYYIGDITVHNNAEVHVSDDYHFKILFLRPFPVVMP